MRNWKNIAAIMLGLLVVLIFTGCAPKGGMLIVLNESSYQLSNVRISLGSTSANQLNPGERLKASVDKNTVGASVWFDLINGVNLVEVPDDGGSFGILGMTYRSSLIGVSGGETVFVTVKNKLP